ncbi:MAG: response regulator [Ferruginibacter sp.]
MHVLFVDNDEDDKELFVEAFNSIAPEVKITTTAYVPDLFIKFEDLKYDLPDFIFLDVNMEQKHGIDCLDEIKTIDWLNDIPVIMYSTSIQPSQVESTFQKGASLYVQKPSGFEYMKSLFLKILSLPTEAYFPQADREHYLMRASK